MKWWVWLIIIIVVLVVLWMIFWPSVHKVKLKAITGSVAPVVEEETHIWDWFYHAYPERVKFVNKSNFDGVIITIKTDGFFEGPPEEFTLGLDEESKVYTVRRGLPSGKVCSFGVNPLAPQPGPRLIKRP